MNSERMRDLTLAVTATLGVIAPGCAESNLNGAQRVLTVEPAAAAVESFDSVEVTRANYTQFLSSDANITYREVILDRQIGVDYLRETHIMENGKLRPKGVNLIKSDVRLPNKFELIDSGDKLIKSLLPLTTNMERRIQAVLFANFSNVIRANDPVVAAEIGVFATTMQTQKILGCFLEDSSGWPIKESTLTSVVVDFVNGTISRDLTLNLDNPLVVDPKAKKHCIG